MKALSNFLPGAASATKRHAERRILRTSPSHLLKVVADVDSYSQFLPLCSKSKILRRSECGTMFDASLTVGMPPIFREDYVSRVKVDGDAMTVEARSIRSTVFDSLRSKWTLRSVPSIDDDEGHENVAEDIFGGACSHSEVPGGIVQEEWCDVEFEVEMRVSDPIIVGVLSQVLEEVAGRQVAAFERRCAEVAMER